MEGDIYFFVSDSEGKAATAAHRPNSKPPESIAYEAAKIVAAYEAVSRRRYNAHGTWVP